MLLENKCKLKKQSFYVGLEGAKSDGPLSKLTDFTFLPSCKILTLTSYVEYTFLKPRSTTVQLSSRNRAREINPKVSQPKISWGKHKLIKFSRSPVICKTHVHNYPILPYLIYKVVINFRISIIAFQIMIF